MIKVLVVVLAAILSGCSNSNDPAPVVKCEDWELYEVRKQGRYNSWVEAEPRCTTWSINGVIKPLNKLND